MTDTDTSIEVLEALDFEMDDECEHSQHKVITKLHSGKGEWWQLDTVCPLCNYNNGRPVLVCDSWKKAVTIGKAVAIRCKRCRLPSYTVEWRIKFIRKDEI